jgi:hypothetical protein
MGQQVRELYIGHQLPRNVAALKQTQLFLLGCQAELLTSDSSSSNRIEVWHGIPTRKRVALPNYAPCLQYHTRSDSNVFAHTTDWVTKLQQSTPGFLRTSIRHGTNATCFETFHDVFLMSKSFDSTVVSLLTRYPNSDELPAVKQLLGHCLVNEVLKE